MIFRKVRHCLLRQSGETTALDGTTAVDPRGARLLVVSRALCRFEFYSMPPGVSRSSAARAARLYADAHAPFTSAGSSVSRGPDGFGIWWWDADHVRAQLSERWPYDPGRIVPETLLQPTADGWRQVRTADGYEGQFWHRHTLVASTWRRMPFSQDAWDAFASGVAIDAPLPLRPDPIDVPLHPISFAWAGAGRDPDWAWNQTARLGGAAMVATAAVAAYFAGQAWHLDTERRHDVAAVVAARQTEQASVTIQRARGELAVVHAFRSRIPTATPVAAAAQALSILGQSGIQVSAWSVDDRTFRARLVLPDRSFSLQALAMALEASPALRNVAPQIDPENMSIMLFADLEEGASRRISGTQR